MADRYDAVIFDMDGVVTDTATVHARAWGELFDGYLSRRVPHAAPFSADDYHRHVDGRARIDGVTTFLGSRGIELELGHPDDPGTAETAWGLANHKNALFVAAVEADGVRSFPTTLDLVRRVRAAGIGTALVTASRNADLILAAAGVADLFDDQVDGTVANQLGLAGKPDPATFLEAARRLGVAPGTAVVVEDALAGVEAGCRGAFGLVIGVDRAGRAETMRNAGADVVVGDLGDLADDTIYDDDPWVLAYRGSDPATEGAREALCTLGNGYLATRGAMAHATADGVHYPGTYVTGTYNRLVSHIEDHPREDESIVNLPNWLALTFSADGGDRVTPDSAHLAGHRVALDLAEATLTRTATVVDAHGRRTRLHERRVVSMASPHLAAIEVRLVAENWSGRLEVRSSVDGDVTNSNVADHRLLANRHLEVLEGSTRGPVACLVTETTQSRIRVAVAVRNQARRASGEQAGPIEAIAEAAAAGHTMSFGVVQGEEVVVEKAVAVVTSHAHGITEPAAAARSEATWAPAFEELLAEHTERWSDLWRHLHIDFANGDEQRRAVRIHLLHLLQTLSPHTTDVDAGVPARGLHGEAYRGHIFWDELFVFPLVDLRLPELTRSLLLYRWRRLPEARRRASALGCRGALFPWQSGSDGREETEAELFNPRSGRWMPDNSRRQYHVNLAVARNVWQHWQVTADVGFLANHGAELLVETARFFSDHATYDTSADRYDLRNVMGPDEFHDGYPDRPGEGIDNNAYLNVLAAWALARAGEVVAVLGTDLGGELRRRLDIPTDELDRWDHLSRRLRVPFLANGLIAQFEGYDELAELDWDRYRRRYSDLGRLDLVLEAEDDSTNRYQVSKQADVLMLFYLFTAGELTALFDRLGYGFDPTTIPATVDHYLARTTHGSTLSRVAHAWVLARSDRTRSWELFLETLDADLADMKTGTTREGIHLGAMAGSVDLLQRCYTGLHVHRDALSFDPQLPHELGSLEFALHYRDQTLTVAVDHHELSLTAEPGTADPITVEIDGDRRELRAGGALRSEIRAHRPRPARPIRT